MNEMIAWTWNEIQHCLTTGAPRYPFGIHINVDIASKQRNVSKQFNTQTAASRMSTFSVCCRVPYCRLAQLYVPRTVSLSALPSPSTPSHMFARRAQMPSCGVARMHNCLRLHQQLYVAIQQQRSRGGPAGRARRALDQWPHNEIGLLLTK